VESRIDVDPDERVADVGLVFDAGPHSSFGETVFRQDAFADRLLRSRVPFRPREPYDARRPSPVYPAFAGRGELRDIDVQPLDAHREQRVIPIEVTLPPAARRQVTYVVGFSTDTGPRLRFGRNNRRFNDRGHQFGVNAQLSPVISEVTANYRLPLGGSQTEWLSFDSGIEREDTETSESESLELSARRVLERPGAWTRSQIVTLRIEDFEVAGQVGRSRLLMPGVDWTRVRADNTIRPRRGSRLSLETRAASDVLGSDTSFVQTIAQGKWIWSLREARVLVRGHVGVTLKRAFDELPPSVRFFAGGDNSVRGYDFEALGPL